MVSCTATCMVHVATKGMYAVVRRGMRCTCNATIYLTNRPVMQVRTFAVTLTASNRQNWRIRTMQTAGMHGWIITWKQPLSRHARAMSWTTRARDAGSSLRSRPRLITGNAARGGRRCGWVAAMYLGKEQAGMAQLVVLLASTSTPTDNSSTQLVCTMVIHCARADSDALQGLFSKCGCQE